MIIRSSNFPRRLDRPLFVAVLCVYFLSCQQVPSTEDKIVGTWEYTTGRTVFGRDHSVVTLLLQEESSTLRWYPAWYGKWRMEGNDIVTVEEVVPIRGYPLPTRTTRMTISEFRPNLLKFADGGAPFVRASLTAERYRQFLALLSVIVSALALAASIYIIRQRPSRGYIFWLAAATATALAWSLLLLVTELTQTGTIIVSTASLSFLQSARVILVIVFVALVTTGLITLSLYNASQYPRTDRE